MPHLTRMAAATVAIGFLLAVPAANARPIDAPAIQTSSLAGTTSETKQNLRGADAQGAPTTSKQNLRGADAQGAPAAPETNPGPPTWPVNPEPIGRVPAQPVAAGSDDGTSPLAYIVPIGAIALMLAAALAYAARPRRARA
jgi:hypothetical protein